MLLDKLQATGFLLPPGGLLLLARGIHTASGSINHLG